MPDFYSFEELLLPQFPNFVSSSASAATYDQIFKSVILYYVIVLSLVYHSSNIPGTLHEKINGKQGETLCIRSLLPAQCLTLQVRPKNKV